MKGLSVILVFFALLVQISLVSTYELHVKTHTHDNHGKDIVHHMRVHENGQVEEESAFDFKGSGSEEDLLTGSGQLTKEFKNTTQFTGDKKTVSYVLLSAKDVQLGPAIAASILIAIGGVVCFAGYRFFRPCAFVLGFFVGGYILAMIIEVGARKEDWVVAGSWTGFIVGGLIAGGIVYWLVPVGIFLVGASAGIALAGLINNSIVLEASPENADVILIILAIVLGCIGGILALKLQRPVVIGTTALVGAHWLVLGVAHFIGHYPDPDNIETDVHKVPKEWWIYLGAEFILFCVGVAVQHTKTAKDGDFYTHASGRQGNVA